MKRDDPAVRESIQFLKNYSAGRSGTISSTGTPAAALSPPVSPLSPQQQDDKGQFQAVVWFLRKRYAADPSEGELPLSSFTPMDIRELLDCFGQELSSTVHKEKIKLNSQTSGERRVNFEPKFSTADNPYQGSNSSGSTAGRGQVLSPFSTPATSATPPYFPKQLSLMTLKEAMSILRKGETVIKYSSAHGKPAYRFLSVRDGRVLYKSELVIMPLLCWSVDAASDPSNQLELCLLTDVRRSVPSSICLTNSSTLPGVSSEDQISSACFVSLVFPSRRLDVGFKRKDIADCWAFALKLIVAKNSTLSGGSN